ncbi:MAG: biotin--[acetyl-CoA-carboxylase] ligase, partial [Sphingomonadales bacterium]
SEEGNLFSSLLLRPECSLKEATNLSFVMSLAVWDVISKITPSSLNIKCKWPNDILLNGKKIAGILLESSAQRNNGVNLIVLGVGINLTHCPEVTSYPTTSLKQENGFAVDAKEMLTSLIFFTDKWIKVWENFGFGAIRTAWLEKAYNLNGLINVNLQNNNITGIFKGLSANGGLILKPEGEPERIIYSGEIFPSHGVN